ncbi:hypothetical protein CAPTEDRAFT_190164 [Capitella teleta]|uniref:Uncharacterized protein n=1 Tax=Capitella teleta TaxID=283909 RepID=R7ULY7_CAPTE|nr:hypothetical protein CAPTEDRAFT_190164 [Capitella teleta]|eukprot:ELU07240.1 hypothetical protein CAPTEDRAFT_190164 [Capitella teleta]
MAHKARRVKMNSQQTCFCTMQATAGFIVLRMLVARLMHISCYELHALIKDPQPPSYSLTPSNRSVAEDCDDISRHLPSASLMSSSYISVATVENSTLVIVRICMFMNDAYSSQDAAFPLCSRIRADEELQMEDHLSFTDKPDIMQFLTQ